ncbi:Cellobiose 2-epimerase [Jannaschia aquimarina]|uniref:Cellobiose 2-epimerase n=1 Tax=Jannaschia aquimarina TaxID=935700 RepID=A0A0D1EH70_9RHOB|nr:AGE family epimerase/isomerase [Jannaschia aquimarina]KIT17024.1 Cellobiose 2-epimerase [Jannaschia aquimarina]SNS81698.1 mannose-6-phosphate isomerase [Jannaschia aquimarina]
MTSLPDDDDAIPAALRRWLTEDALPLWTGLGFDAATETVWESLTHDGAPRRHQIKRLRVQVRQAYVFAQARGMSPGAEDLAVRLFARTMEDGFDQDGHLAANLDPRTGARLDSPHDLYDLAFVLLATSALIDAGHGIESDLKKLRSALEKLKAARGWHETAERRQPRRQNPHMHLFEASTALFAATGDAFWRDVAQECLDLLGEVFLAPEGRLLEHFDADWCPLPDGGGQQYEPGHMVEWIWLLDAWEKATGLSSGIDPAPLWHRALDRRFELTGCLPDQSDPTSDFARTWPQTEMLKAAIVMTARGDNRLEPDQALRLLWDRYLTGPVPGGWYDRLDRHGSVISDNMPASTFYHIWVALRARMTGPSR